MAPEMAEIKNKPVELEVGVVENTCAHCACASDRKCSSRRTYVRLPRHLNSLHTELVWGV